MNINNILDNAIAITGGCILLITLIWAANWWLTLLLFS